MIAGLRELLAGARRPLAAFSCYDLESAVGVLRAAAGRPVVLLVSARAISDPDGELLVAALRAVAEQAPGPVCLQLDHAHDLEAIGIACEHGVGAVMADGSHLGVAANAAFVMAARAIAVPRNVAVEAALGRIAGDEEVAVPALAGEATDVEQARRFTAETGADCLAVAVGNVHGIYGDRPRLDLVRLRSLAGAVAAPLVLHGGSGLPARALSRLGRAGAAKVNFNTALRQAYLWRTQEELATASAGARLLALHRAQTEAVAVAAAERFAQILPRREAAAPCASRSRARPRSAG